MAMDGGAVGTGVTGVTTGCGGAGAGLGAAGGTPAPGEGCPGAGGTAPVLLQAASVKLAPRRTVQSRFVIMLLAKFADIHTSGPAGPEIAF